MAQILTASLEQADDSHLPNQTSDGLVLGIPFREYNYADAAVRAATLGRAVSQAAMPSPVQADAYAQAFTQSFSQQTPPCVDLYGFTVALP